MLLEMLCLKNFDTVSIIGSGGKTSLMFYIAHLLKNKKVCVTTTTKIYLPRKSDYDYLILAEKAVRPVPRIGVHVFGKSLDSFDKILGYEPQEIIIFSRNFDFTLIESDGAKQKPLKAWATHEPVICEETSKTIGVITLKNIGETISEEIIHRHEIFKKFVSEGEQHILPKHIKNAILGGIFEKAVGEKILFINKCDTELEIDVARKFLDTFSEQELSKIDKIVFGSVVKKIFHIYKVNK